MADKSKIPDPPPSTFDKHLVKAPGPGKYNLPSEFGAKKGANKWSMAARLRTVRTDETPGPDKYAYQRTSFGGTKSTMAARLPLRDKDMSVPPPSDGKAVVPPTVRSYIGQGPKFSMGGRTRSVRSDLTPDPTKYDPLGALKRTSERVPAFSMAARPRTLAKDPYRPDVLPTDGKAVIPPSVKPLVGTGGPKYSMSGRTHRPRTDAGPGPGAYSGAHHNTIGKGFGPSFSMSARVRGGIQYGRWGDEPRLSARLPPLQPLQVVHSH